MFKLNLDPEKISSGDMGNISKMICFKLSKC